MTKPIFYFTEGPRIFFSSLKNRITHKKYPGDATKICQKIVDECWNGRFFQTSTGNFAQFWTRDFGWCTQSLLKLGYEKQVHHTIRYALNIFKKSRVTTTITPKGKPFDFPTVAVDTLPWFIHSIKISKFPYRNHREFLNKQIRRFYRTFINEKTGLVKKNVHFSSMKDFAIRKSSCYDNCMVALLAKDLKDMKLLNPFAKFNHPKLIKENFWNGEFFYDDLEKKKYIAADANLFPYIFGIIKDKKMMSSSLKVIRDTGLDSPFPLKYTSSRKHVKFIAQELVMRNYESNAIWMHMGPLFVKWVSHLNPALAKEYKARYTKLIERHKTFPEVLTAKGKPYSSIYYHCDYGMLWAANYLTL